MWSTALTVLAVMSLKCLLIPFYRSTDFEVHRNWLAITYSLPVKQWYTEATSEWTLDYPPLFAWWEWSLAHFARLVDPQMLQVSNLNYASNGTVAFQRLSVIATDVVLAMGVSSCHKGLSSLGAKTHSSRFALALLVLANAGLIMVDNIHFQYNGFLFGILLLSMGSIMQQKIIEGAFWFAVLLNLKHIFMYCAPVYFIYLLRHYCLQLGLGRLRSLQRLVTLGLIVISVFALSFWPFVMHDQVEVVFKRLFPFKRGLSHAYWAPNFWALYNGADRILTLIGRRFDLFSIPENVLSSMTGGLVQEVEHTVLKTVTPLATFVCAALAMMPALIKLWSIQCGPKDFVRGIVLTSFASFMFGWHVHEKAILMVVIPLSILVVEDISEASLFLLLSTTANVSLFPLLFRPEELLIKILLTVGFALCYIKWFHSQYGYASSRILNTFEWILMYGLSIPVILEMTAPHVQIFQRFQFLPLMTYSLYCSFCLSYCFIKLYYLLLVGQKARKVKSK